MKFLIMALAALFCVDPAGAAPVLALAPLIGAAAGASVALQLGLAVASTVATSLLTKAKKVTTQTPGITITTTAQGGTNSRTIMLGLYATAGSEACPPMSHGQAGKTPNAYFTKVHTLADFPVDGLNRIIINGEYVDIGTVEEEYGFPLGGKYAGYGWVKAYDGRQTAPDPMLIAKYTDYVRPWDGDRIGKGVAYAICTFLFNDQIYKNVPDVRYEVRGIRAYDLRKDSSVGGNGAHRWDDPSTWEYTVNNAVLIYNIKRGIVLADGLRYGGNCEASDLPVSNWAAAMNVCDETVVTEFGQEPRYRCGYEILISDMEPASVIEELLKGCNGSVVENGGVYKIRVGPPSLPIAFVTDDDFLVSEPSDFDPFPSLATASNTITASYPNPAETWSAHDAPPITNADYVDQDGGEQVTSDLQFPAVPYDIQVQRLMLAYLNDDRRWRSHKASFGHYAFAWESLDCISWSSQRNGYVNKLFEINNGSEDTRTLKKQVTLREVDPTDYDWTSQFQLPDPVSPGVWDLPLAQAVPGFAAEALVIKDNSGTGRRPAIRVSWTPDGALDAKLLKIQIRNATTFEAVTDTTVTNIPDGSTIIVDGILPMTAYQVRAMYVADRATIWSSWIGVTTGDVRFGDADIDGYAALKQAVTYYSGVAADALDDAAYSLSQALLALQGVQQNTIDINTTKTDLSTLNAGFTILQGSVTTLEQDVSGITTDLSTALSSLQTQSLAIADLQGGQANFNTYLQASAGSPQLLHNGGFSRGLDYWMSNVGGWNVMDSPAWGRIAYNTSAGGDIFLDSARYPATPNVAYTFSADSAIIGSGGSRFEIVFFDAAGNDIGHAFGADLAGGYDFEALQTRRKPRKATATAPAGTAGMQARFYFYGIPSGTFIGVRLAKLERGQYMTPFSEEGSTIDAMGRISNEEAVRSTADYTISQSLFSVSTTVNGHTSNISQLFQSVNGLFARAAVTLDVNGYVTGWELVNAGQGQGAMTINADYFAIVKPGGGPRTEYSNGNWRVYDGNGVLRVAMGVNI